MDGYNNCQSAIFLSCVARPVIGLPTSFLIMNKLRAALFAALLLTINSLAAAEFAERQIDFNRPDATYTSRMARQDFGNATLVATRRSVSVTNGALRIRFVKGMKVDQTGVCLLAAIPSRPQYTLEYRIRYDGDFETGLHGKQFGLSGGKSYTGGLGGPCRTNGDGWSVRLQFDAHADEISNQLYVYHCGMTGAYGESLGTHRSPFYFKRGEWHQIRLLVTMQSSPTAQDGRIEVWCDGQKKIEVSEVRFVSKEAGRQIDRVRLESFPGGAGIIPTRDSFLQVDDVRWFASDISRTNVLKSPP